MDKFSGDAVGCVGSAKDPYLWRPAGYGSNINSKSHKQMSIQRVYIVQIVSYTRRQSTPLTCVLVKCQDGLSEVQVVLGLSEL